MVNKLNKSFYNTVLSQTFSHCGNYLIVGDIYGSVSVLHLSPLIHQETVSKEDQQPKNSFVVKSDVQINSLAATKSFLLVGTVGEIIAYGWKTLKSSKKPIVSWSCEIPSSKDDFHKPDVNCMIVNEDGSRVYVGCGDNNVYIFDTETRQVLKTLKGHRDYVHGLSVNNGKLASCGEDGFVFIWDLKTLSQINKIEPHTKDKVTRPDLGSWIGGVDLSDDWLLCGGGPRLSLWHLRSMNISTVFPIEDKGIHVVEIYQDKIFAGGRSNLFYQMGFNGDIITEIPTSPVTTYSVVHQEEPFKALCIAGSSPKIDVCSNFIYKDLQLSLS